MPKGCARSSPLPSASRFAQTGETPRQNDALPQRTTRAAAPSPRSNHCGLIAPLSLGRLLSFNQVYFQSMGSIPSAAERHGLGFCNTLLLSRHNMLKLEVSHKLPLNHEYIACSTRVHPANKNVCHFLKVRGN